MSIFDYRVVSVAPRSLADVAERIMTSGQSQVNALGGSLFGVWLGIIGFARDEGVVMSAWPDVDSASTHGPAAVDVPGVLNHLGSQLSPTVRPMDATPPTSGGVYAHRWFELAADDWDNFQRLSADAWPHMERDHDANIIGLWLDVNAEARQAKALLLTRYRDLSVWEASRWWSQPDPEADGASRRFKSRGELTQATHVNITTLSPYRTV
ncbi:MAG: hypothetical protein AAF493_17570 [Pseudomonadota bacterium]